MQGIMIDDNGAFVNAAIIKLTEITDSDEESYDESKEVAVTYGKTDEAGRFIVQKINPKAEYIIEVHIAIPEPEVVSEDNPEADEAFEENSEANEAFEENQEADDVFDENQEPDEDYMELIASEPINASAADIRIDADTEQRMISRNCMYRLDCVLKENLYLMKNNVW